MYVRHYAILCHIIPFHIMPCYTVINNAILCHALPYRTAPYRAIAYRAVPYRTVPLYIIYDAYVYIYIYIYMCVCIHHMDKRHMQRQTLREMCAHAIARTREGERDGGWGLHPRRTRA